MVKKPAEGCTSNAEGQQDTLSLDTAEMIIVLVK